MKEIKSKRNEADYNKNSGNKPAFNAVN